MPLAGGGLGRVAPGKGQGRDENKQGFSGKQNGDSGISLRCFPGKTSYLEWPLKGALPDLPEVSVSGNNTVAIPGGQQHLPFSPSSAAQQCRPYPFCPITAAPNPVEVPADLGQESQASSWVGTWNSACLSRCPWGERPLVELYLEPGVFFRTMHGRVTAPSC